MRSEGGYEGGRGGRRVVGRRMWVGWERGKLKVWWSEKLKD